ncbi:prolyl oligopeptidase family serine peptidase [Tamlana sp. 2201CG12-4]|uniref:S9 family peptidase n=1 Tax=Tamlana sp. 2201CG12-4 TaxID=3112582 RepID=UPI002DBF6DCA|nr:prolyl oligopeptidase family serine peptidase [Tamlana sp. 2201CG12-4]MEC3906714.1 prolyl oligopeptidase family serine peptidase [Tamlana sp. 2201CG12-4]
MKHYIRVLAVCYLYMLPIQAQHQVTKDDYKRAVSFMYDNYNNKTAFNLNTSVNWFEDGSGFWFVDYSKDNKTYKTVDLKKGKVKALFDHDKLAKALTKLNGKEVKSNDLSLSDFENLKGKLSFKTNNKTVIVDLKSYKLEEKKANKEKEENPFEAESPDGKWVAYTKDYNLFIKSVKTKEEYQLSIDGDKGYEYASWYGWYDKMEGENGERPKRFYVNWSEDSKWIATTLVDTRTAEKMYLLDHSIDSLYKPKLMAYYRGSPGDSTMVKITPVFYNIETKKEVKTNLPTGTHINAVSANWMKDSGALIASYSKRGFLKQYVKLVNLNTNTEQVLIEETSNTGIDNFEYRILEDKQKIIFLSERTGWRQLHILDINTGQIKLLTSGDYYINSIKYIDEENGIIYYLASGKIPENNPYHQQLYKVDFKGNETLLTPDDKHHSVSFSEDGSYFVDASSTITIPTKTVLRASKTGALITELTSADVSQAEAIGWMPPSPFSLMAKDGKTTIYGALWKPTHFNSNTSYPNIDATYTGPHTQRFPKSFNRGFDNQSLAELGFIVVQIDGLGTSGRSKEFHDHSYKNMENNLEDHVLAIKHLSEKYSWIDINKVGIFGHSAGGYDTGRALLGFPDFYKVGVASSADHDFRMEKAWWPEMYQGWPVDETYEKVSNITNAEKLKGKLLLTHGGIDDNVNPSATFKLAEALIKADKDFDLLILPSQRHGYRGKHRRYFIKKRWNYFVEHLLGAEPLWDFKWN